MNLRDEIEAAVGTQALTHGAFYANPVGLRFELSKGGSAVEMFLEAMRKATRICEDIFSEEQTLTVCLSIFVERTFLEARVRLRQLERAGIVIPPDRFFWSTDADGDYYRDGKLIHLAFKLSRARIENLLWCALGVDLGIEPCPLFDAIRLVSLPQRVLVHPYDDRGMDVVGGNRALLARLYAAYGDHLLEYDRHLMRACFEQR